MIGSLKMCNAMIPLNGKYDSYKFRQDNFDGRHFREGSFLEQIGADTVDGDGYWIRHKRSTVYRRKYSRANSSHKFAVEQVYVFVVDDDGIYFDGTIDGYYDSETIHTACELMACIMEEYSKYRVDQERDENLLRDTLGDDHVEVDNN